MNENKIKELKKSIIKPCKYSFEKDILELIAYIEQLEQLIPDGVGSRNEMLARLRLSNLELNIGNFVYVANGDKEAKGIIDWIDLDTRMYRVIFNGHYAAPIWTRDSLGDGTYGEFYLRPTKLTMLTNFDWYPRDKLRLV